MKDDVPDRAELLSMWDALAGISAGDRLYRTRKLERPDALDLRVGLRETDRAPCLVAVTEAADASAIAAFETGGLRLSRAPDDGDVLLVLSLEEPTRRDLFAQVCSDLLRSVARSGAATSDIVLRELAERLAAWRSFLRDQVGMLQRHEVVGIAGELVVLEHLLEHQTDGLGAWRSPDDGLFDFERFGKALEVKTTLGAGNRLRISSLDQLDDVGLSELALVHVRLAEDPQGDGVVSLARRIDVLLASDRLRRNFQNALLRRGLPPDADESLPPFFRLIGLDFFRVSPGFPRLLRRDVPAAVVEASYDLELRGLADHAVPADEILLGFGVGFNG